jgi:hypothetical protein
MEFCYFFEKVSFFTVFVLRMVWDVFHDLKNVKIAKRSKNLSILAYFGQL